MRALDFSKFATYNLQDAKFKWEARLLQIGYGYSLYGVLSQFEEIWEPTLKSKDDGVFQSMLTSGCKWNPAGGVLIAHPCKNTYRKFSFTCGQLKYEANSKYIKIYTNSIRCNKIGQTHCKASIRVWGQVCGNLLTTFRRLSKSSPVGWMYRLELDDPRASPELCNKERVT